MSALVGIGISCGDDDDDSLVCGPGTVEVDGECVVDNPVECATGPGGGRLCCTRELGRP